MLVRLCHTFHRSHSHGLAVHDLVEFHREMSRLSRDFIDVVQRVFVVAAPLTHHTYRLATPISDVDVIVATRLWPRERSGGSRNHEIHGCNHDAPVTRASNHMVRPPWALRYQCFTGKPRGGEGHCH